MNFSYGIIGIVGVLAAISIGFIAMDPTDIIEPRVDENLLQIEQEKAQIILSEMLRENIQECGFNYCYGLYVVQF